MHVTKGELVGYQLHLRPSSKSTFRWKITCGMIQSSPSQRDPPYRDSGTFANKTNYQANIFFFFFFGPLLIFGKCQLIGSSAPVAIGYKTKRPQYPMCMAEKLNKIQLVRIWFNQSYL